MARWLQLSDAKSAAGDGVAADASLSTIRVQLEKERRAREQAEASLAASRRQHNRDMGEAEQAHAR